MRRRFALSLILVLACGGCLADSVDVGAQAALPSANTPCVILLHGLGRTPCPCRPWPSDLKAMAIA